MLIVRSANEVLNEIKRIKKLESDVALSDIFGVKPSTLSTWRSRNSIPYDEILSYCAKEDISTDMLFFNKCLKVSKEVSIPYGRTTTITIELDDLFTTRLERELRGRSLEWLANKCRIDEVRLKGILEEKFFPAFDELDAISDALNVSVTWLAERPKIDLLENCRYEFYKKICKNVIPDDIFKLYLIDYENIITEFIPLIDPPTQRKADIISTACRVHMKETPYLAKANSEIIRTLLHLFGRDNDY